jgi:HSP20 family molecular chaperone IbpA
MARSQREVSRLFSLSDDAAADQVAAEFQDGVLTIEIPRAEEKKPAVINIQ